MTIARVAVWLKNTNRMKNYIYAFLFGALVVSLLLFIGYPVLYGGANGGCKKCSSAERDMVNFGAALNQYQEKNGYFPNSLNELYPYYYSRVPLDPWGNNYHYKIFSHDDRLCFHLWSLGSDGKYGGIDHASDIGVSHKYGHCIKMARKINDK